MPWATPLHTRGPPESPCGHKDKETLSRASLLLPLALRGRAVEVWKLAFWIIPWLGFRPSHSHSAHVNMGFSLSPCQRTFPFCRKTLHIYMLCTRCSSRCHPRPHLIDGRSPCLILL